MEPTSPNSTLQQEAVTNKETRAHHRIIANSLRRITRLPRMVIANTEEVSAFQSFQLSDIPDDP